MIGVARLIAHSALILNEIFFWKIVVTRRFPLHVIDEAVPFPQMACLQLLRGQQLALGTCVLCLHFPVVSRHRRKLTDEPIVTG